MNWDVHLLFEFQLLLQVHLSASSNLTEQSVCLSGKGMLQELSPSVFRFVPFSYINNNNFSHVPPGLCEPVDLTGTSLECLRANLVTAVSEAFVFSFFGCERVALASKQLCEPSWSLLNNTDIGLLLPHWGLAGWVALLFHLCFCLSHLRARPGSLVPRLWVNKCHPNVSASSKNNYP